MGNAPDAKEILDIVPDEPYRVAIIMPTPEELTSAGEIVEAALTPQMGGDKAREVKNILSTVGWSRCVGGWVPLVKALNMAYGMMDFPRNNCMVSWVHFGTYGKTAAEQRNYGVAEALDRGAEYIWMQDWDVLNPRGAFGGLFQADVDIISGVYWMKEEPPRTMVIAGHNRTFFDGWWKNHGKVMGGRPCAEAEVVDGVQYQPGDVIGGQQCRVGDIYGGDQLMVIPCGCLLIKADVFRNIEPPWFKQGGGFLRDGFAIDFTDDAYFCQRARDAGYKLNLHTAVQCGHLDVNRGVEFGFNMRSEENPEGNNQPGWRFITETAWRPHEYRKVEMDDAYLDRVADTIAGEAVGDDPPSLAGVEA